MTQNLTGFTVMGKLLYGGWGYGITDVQGMSFLPVPLGAIVDGPNGGISLSLPSTSTGFKRQQFKAWENPAYFLLIVRPMITGPNGGPLVTVGLQLLFVF